MFEFDSEVLLLDLLFYEMLYFGGGRKDKISKGDVVGFLIVNLDLWVNEIGMIISQDKVIFVVILCEEVIDMLKVVWDKKIKGKCLKIVCVC